MTDSKHHIIGAPPEKRGATFGDVPCGGDFMVAGCRHFRSLSPNDCLNALNLATGRYCFVADDTPVDLLTLTPVEPEPGPAVTYGELEPGRPFAWRGLLYFALDDEYALSASTGRWLSLSKGASVRRLTPAEVAQHFAELAGGSFVEHEEPGSRACLSPDGHPLLMTRRGWEMLTVPSDEQGDEWAMLAALRDQAAALLAQRDAKPECTCCGADAASGKVVGSGPICAACCKAAAKSVGAALLAQRDVDAIDRGIEEACKHHAEDRGKPAPGYVVESGALDCAEWKVTTCGLEPLVEHGEAPWSKADAIAYTWAQHDAQKGGAS